MPPKRTIRFQTLIRGPGYSLALQTNFTIIRSCTGGNWKETVIPYSYCQCAKTLLSLLHQDWSVIAYPLY